MHHLTYSVPLLYTHTHAQKHTHTHTHTHAHAHTHTHTHTHTHIPYIIYRCTLALAMNTLCTYKLKYATACTCTYTVCEEWECLRARVLCMHTAHIACMHRHMYVHTIHIHCMYVRTVHICCMYVHTIHMHCMYVQWNPSNPAP